MTSKKFIPERGDIVSISFSPQSGHEQAGRRPAIVLSPRQYNEKTGLAIMCPITSKIKGYPFEVDLPDSLKTKGVVLSDQVKNLDWRAREVAFIERLPVETLGRIQEKLLLLIRY